MAFESPNFTQTPNDLFDTLLPDMSLAELKVTLAAIRHTFGFHRDTFKLSIADMMKSTGLSKHSVLTGACLAEKRGTMRREISNGTTIWVVQILHPYVVQKIDRLHIVKERNKERPNGRKPKNNRLAELNVLT